MLCMYWSVDCFLTDCSENKRTWPGGWLDFLFNSTELIPMWIWEMWMKCSNKKNRSISIWWAGEATTSSSECKYISLPQIELNEDTVLYVKAATHRHQKLLLAVKHLNNLLSIHPMCFKAGKHRMRKLWRKQANAAHKLLRRVVD